MIGFAASGWVGANTGIPAVLGPLAHSVRDLRLLARVVRDAKPWQFDPAVVPQVTEIRFKPRKPVVGVIYQSGLTPHPPVRRAMREAAEKLSAAGLLVKHFVPPDFNDIRRVTRELFTLDGLSYQRGQLAEAGEPVVPSVEKIGFWNIPKKSHEQAWALNAKKLTIQKDMLDRWQAASIDLVIAPSGPHAAVKPDDWTNDMYTVCWNAVDVSCHLKDRIEDMAANTSTFKYPAVIVPFTTVDPDLDPPDAGFVPMHDLDAQVQALCKWFPCRMSSAYGLFGPDMLMRIDDPKLMAGAPVALQIVGPRFGDEQLLEDAQAIDAILNQRT